MITFVDEKGTEHSALVAYSVTNAVNGELSVKGTIYTNDEVLHGIGRGWRFRLDDEYYRITYAKPNDTGRQIEVEFDAVHQFFYDMSKSMVYTTLNGSKPFETYLQAIFSGSGYTYNLETTVGSIRKENFGNKSRLSLFNDIIKAAGLEFSVRGHVIRILKRIGTDLSTIVRKDFNMNELKIEKNINSFVTYQRGLGAWKDDEDHSKGRYETSYESPLSAIYGRIEADPIVDERYKDTGKLLERLKENVDKSYKVSVEIDMEDLSQAGYRISRPNPGDYIMAINETLGFRQKVRIVSFTSEYDVGGNLISRKVVCNDIGTVQRVTSEISHLSRTLTDSIEGSERALKTATKALVSADGKNTNYFGDVKPLDVPKGTLRKGDRLFLTVGDKKQLYFWNGAEWELEPTEFDHEKFDMEFNRNSQEIKKTIQENRQKAEEALRNAGASSLLAQEAKRIGLDSVAKLEEFKRQSTSAQTALSGDLDALKRTIANDIRPKQVQVETEIAKQVEALIQTKKELAGVKSTQATYEETTTRRLAELTNLADGKASKSELTQTAEELKSRIASVQVGGRNYVRNGQFKNGSKNWLEYQSVDFGLNFNYQHSRNPNNRNRPGLHFYHESQDVANFFGIQQSFAFEGVRGEKVSVSLLVSKDGGDSNSGLKVALHYIKNKTIIGQEWQSISSTQITSKYKRFTFMFTLSDDVDNLNLMLYGEKGKNINLYVTDVQLERGSAATDYKEAPEDTENQISAVESNFKQRADALEAGVSRLTEGLRTKADISSLNVTAENIRQSVKSLETDTQDKLNKKLSLAEFEVQAGSIQQEILNVSKDKADKTLVTAEAGKLREEFSNLRVGGRNLIRNYDWNGLLPLLSNQVGWKFERVEDQFAKSGYMLKATCTRAGNGGFYKTFFDLRANEFQGKDMTWSWDIKSSRPITFYDMGFEAGGLKRNVSISTEWTRIINTFKVSFKQYYSCVFYAKGWQVDDVVYIRDPQLEEGTIATSPKPAPEDTDGLITEAKATFERTAQGLRTDLSAIQSYVDKDGQRQEELKSYARNESITHINIYRQDVARNYILRSRYDEDARNIRQKFEAITNSQNGLIATKIADYKHSVDGRFAEITSLLSRKANQTDFQRVKETSQLYERILGNTENGIADKVARMALTNQLFQVEVAKASASGRNLFLNSLFKRDLRKRYSTYDLFDGKDQTQGQLALSIDTNEKFKGANTLKIVSAFNGKQSNQKATFTIGGDARLGTIDEMRNKSVRFSFWAKSTVNNTIFQARSGYRGSIQSVPISTDWKFYDIELVRKENSNATSELILHVFTAATVWIAFPKIEIGTVATPFTEAPEDTDEAIRSVQSQLAGSWAVQNLTSAGSIISQINATNNQILIEAEKIRLKGKTLLDELTAIQGYFKRLFVGEGTFATLNADVIRTNSITADKLVMDMAMARRFVSSDLFTDTLAAKEAFINKLRSVVVTATLLEGYRGRIGGFQIGTHDNDPSSFWLTGLDQFKVGMSNGRGREFQTAFWANWGNTWGKPGPLSWYVTLDGQMYCNNNATFHRVVDFSSTCSANFYGANSFYKDIYMRNGSEIYGTGSTPRAGGKNSVVWWNQVGDGSLKYHIDMASDKRLKENIVDSNIVALDKIKQLKMKSFDFISTGKHEEVGLIAQEVEAILPSVISKNPEKADDYLHIDYVAIVPYLIKSIQELNQKIEEMEKIVA